VARVQRHPGLFQAHPEAGAGLGRGSRGDLIVSNLARIVGPSRPRLDSIVTQGPGSPLVTHSVTLLGPSF
jgi:hypothetical protein